jgi:hypothetical protein
MTEICQYNDNQIPEYGGAANFRNVVCSKVSATFSYKLLTRDIAI